MMTDFHVHTNFCDGLNTPEEMVQSAIEKGLDAVGIVAHSYTYFDREYCIDKERVEEFKAEVKRLKEKYKDRIEVLCGVEQDYYSEESTEGFDYVIGSMHYLLHNGKYYPLDDSKDALELLIGKEYGGDAYAMCEDYYNTVCDLVEKTNANIIGHIDIVTKFNEGGVMFSQEHPRYIAAYKKAIDKLVEYGKPFEINTGVMARVGKTHPYPAEGIKNYILYKGGTFVLSSDAHDVNTVAYEFKEWAGK